MNRAAAQGEVAKGLGIKGGQLKAWRQENKAHRPMEAKRCRKVDAVELARLRKEKCV